jgi:hypothetical protein
MPCHAVLPHLLKRGGGTVVNVSSNATRGIRRVPYSADNPNLAFLFICLLFYLNNAKIEP